MGGVVVVNYMLSECNLKPETIHSSRVCEGMHLNTLVCDLPPLNYRGQTGAYLCHINMSTLSDVARYASCVPDALKSERTH